MRIHEFGWTGLPLAILFTGTAIASPWLDNGSNNTNAGNVGIGINPPAVKLHLEADGTSESPGPYPANGTAHFISWAGDGPATETGIPLFRLNAARIATFDPNASRAVIFEVTTDDKRLFGVRGNGYVGIGTSAPSVPLDVQGRTRITGMSPGQEALIVNQEASSGALFNVRQGNNSKLLIDFNGNVGLGAAANGGPLLDARFKVDTDGSSSSPGSYPTQAVANFTSWAGDGPDVDNDVSIFRISAARINSTDANASKAKVFEVALDDRRAFVVRGNGNVGINNPSPSQKLDVDGNIKATGTLEVAGVITRTWTVAPDYVFEKDYKLRSLEEVGAFVKKNKHLPEVPSAKQFKEKGINLAEMNLLLLKKVEELTLHAIRQEEKLKELENRLGKKGNP